MDFQRSEVHREDQESLQEDEKRKDKIEVKI
jgi:hypothetical protein